MANNNTLIVNATDGVTAETREQIIAYREAGVSEIVVILNNTKSVDDEDLLDLVEMEIRDLLSSYDYNGDHATITRK
jgi:elongation factor Tu